MSEHLAETSGHETFYLAEGPEDGPLVIFCHGWPLLSLSWRHQLSCFASLGFRAVAPDMRGYGRSTVHDRHEDYAIERIVADMTGLLDALGRERAIWVGHDWGAPVVWSIAAHHPDRCHGVAAICVPYGTVERGLDSLLPLVNRDIYPAAEFPFGQWEYVRYYEEDFAAAIAPLDKDPRRAIKALFRKGTPEHVQAPSPTAYVRRVGGWFGGAPAPEVPLDEAVLSEGDLEAYASALGRNGFFGPCSWYVNGAANSDYALRAANGGRIDLPALFIAAEYDATCETVTSRLAEPMRANCSRLHEIVIPGGHWLPQEQPGQVNAALVGWIARALPQCWPVSVEDR